MTDPPGGEIEKRRGEREAQRGTSAELQQPQREKKPRAMHVLGHSMSTEQLLRMSTLAS